MQLAINCAERTEAGAFSVVPKSGRTLVIWSNTSSTPAVANDPAFVNVTANEDDLARGDRMLPKRPLTGVTSLF